MILLQGKMSNSSVPQFAKLDANLQHRQHLHQPMPEENVRIAITSVSITQKRRIVLNGFRKSLPSDARKMILLQGNMSASFVQQFVELNAIRPQRCHQPMTVENARIAILSISIMQKGRIVLNGFRLSLKNDARKMIKLQGKKSNSSVQTFVKLNANLQHRPQCRQPMIAENVKIVIRFVSITNKTSIVLHGFW
jgi:hypothetical protein